MNINLSLFDDVFDDDLTKKEEKIHVYIKQRNTRKYNTMIYGLEKRLPLIKTLKELKEFCSSSGTIKDDNGNKYILLFGNQKDKISMYLEKYGIDKNLIVFHGVS